MIHPKLEIAFSLSTNHMRNLPFISISLFCVFGTLLAQNNPQPYFRNYTTDQGLPSSEVYCAYQDSKGYMWFGTDNGAARFDGYQFETFDAEDGLTSNVVFDIKEDGRGRIWFGTMTGEAFIWEGDTIMPYPHNHLVLKHREQYSDATLTGLLPDETAYFELKLWGILRIDSFGRDSLISIRYPHGYLMLNVKEFNRTVRVKVNKVQDAEYKEWINSFFNKQFVWAESYIKGKGFEIVTSRKYDQYNHNFNAQFVSADTLIYHRFGQLFAIKGHNILWQIPFLFSSSEIIVDQRGNIWFCGTNNSSGLRKYQNIQAIKAENFDLYLEKYSISNIFLDTKGGLWVTTLEQGVFYANDLQLLTYDKRFGLNEDYVNAMTVKNENEVFIGNKNGHLYQVDVKKGKIISENLVEMSFPIFDLFYDHNRNGLWVDGKFWHSDKWKYLSIINNGGLVYPFQTRRFEKQQITQKGFLIGCNLRGVSYFDLQSGMTLFITGFDFGRTYSVFESKNGIVWAGNNLGLHQIIVEDSLIKKVDIDHPAFHIRIEDIDEFPDSSLVFGTKGMGVIRWKGNKIEQFTKKEGLSSNMIEDVHVDENGVLWVGTLSGLNKVQFSNSSSLPTIRQYKTSNGLPSNEIIEVKSHQDQVWLCTPKGLVKFHEPPIDTIAPNPLIQRVIVNNNLQKLGPPITLKSHQNNLEFGFLAINYRMNANILYRYRLNKTDFWQHTNNQFVNYPALPSGNYQFEVQAQNEDGYWSISTFFPFIIKPHWTATWWFRLIGAFILGLIGYGMYKYRMQQLKKANRIKQQIQDLEKSALQAQMNPHFIFNCLNSIQNFILQNDKKKAVEYLARFAKLVRLNLEASVNGFVTLEEEVKLLDHYLALEKERSGQKFDFSIQMSPSIKDLSIEFPPLLIQPFVENAIIHGVSKKNSKGSIHINFSQRHEQLFVKVIDNGKGYKATERSVKEKRESLGMCITQQRLKLLDGYSNDVVKINAIKNEQHEIIGTEVSMKIHAKTK